MIKVLVVDDSAVIRNVLKDELSRDPEIEVVGAAPDPYVARDMIVARNPDVLSLDIEMPRMDGLTFLHKLMRHHPLPVVVLSSLTEDGSGLALDALAAGAVEVVSKGSSAFAAESALACIGEKLKAAARVDIRRFVRRAATCRAPVPLANRTASHTVVAIGASTGGTVALEAIVRTLPANFPGTVVTQHMPEVFTRSFAERLNNVSELTVREASDGDSVVPGVVLIAPGNRHLVVRRSGARFVVGVKDGPHVNRHRPSVDVLFQSVARSVGKNAVGVLLTGMGTDGARGLLALRGSGAHTVAQDEASSVVFGMPKVAIELDAAVEVVGLERIPDHVCRVLTETTPAALRPRLAPGGTT